MAEMVRLQSRISVEINNWLENRASQTGIPKNTLVILALEQYINQHRASGSIQEIEDVLKKLKSMTDSEGNKLIQENN